MIAKKNQDPTDVIEDGDEDTQKDKFLCFRIGTEEYGIEIKFVTEIIGLQKITPVPEMPEFIRGVINLRGKIIPVMDIRLRFRMAAREFDERTCVVVVNVRDTSIGLIVDRVSEVISIPENQVENTGTLGSSKSNAYIRGIGKVGDSIKILLDVNALLYDAEGRQIENPEGMGLVA